MYLRRPRRAAYAKYFALGLCLHLASACKTRPDESLAKDASGVPAGSFLCSATCPNGTTPPSSRTLPCTSPQTPPSCDQFNTIELPVNCRYAPTNINACQTADDDLVRVDEQIDTKKYENIRKVGDLTVQYHNLDPAGLTQQGKDGLQTMINFAPEETPLPFAFTKLSNKTGGSETDLWFKRGLLPSPYVDQYSNTLPLAVGHNKSTFKTRTKDVLDATSLNCLFCHSGSIGYDDPKTGASVLISAGIPNKDSNFPHLVAEDFKKIESFLAPGFTGTMERTLAKLTPFELKTLGNSWSTQKTFQRPILSYARFRGAAPIGLIQHSETSYYSKQDMFTSAPLLPYPEATEKIFINRFNPSVRPTTWWSNKHKATALWVPYVLRRNDPEVGYDQQPRDFTYAFQHVDNGNYRMQPAKKYAYIKRIFDYIKEVTSPRYPLPLDPASVERGSDAFHGSAGCAGCHGTYTNYGEYGDGKYKVCYTGGVKNAGTDPEYRKQIDEMAPIWNYANAANSNPKLITYDTSKLPPGYQPPVLEGVWAIAPYFHNGSVPNLWAVLKSTERPKTWAQYSATSYEIRNAPGEKTLVGLKYQTSGATPDYPLYDTTQKGFSNQGHTFGDALDDQTRTDIINFLLDVSGDQVIPDPERIPTVSPDQYTVSAKGPTSVSAKEKGVLANDQEGCTGGLVAKVTKAGSPAHGKLQLNEDGTFTYTPADGYQGEDAFKYRAFSGSFWSDEVLVKLTVN